MFKDYYACRVWLESFIPQTYSRENLGLERIEYLLKLLGNPEKKFKSIHVGGTSGKGSTCFYIARILQLKKYKIGLHLSPHLVYIGERMQINGKEISVSRLVRLINEIKPLVEQMRASQLGKPSYFEILVALSFKYFADSKVDFAVVEVGLGGRLDATNVLQPQIALITNVGLDHTEILGNSVEKIAEEKAGIIKNGVPVVTGVLPSSGSLTSGKALKIIEKVAKAKKSKLITLDTRSIEKSAKIDIFKPSSIYKETLRDTSSQLAFSNKLLAIMAVSELKIRLSSRIVKKAFSESLEGRFEEIDRGVILDGAHNTDKIQFLISNIKYQISNTLRANKSESRSKRRSSRRARTINGVILVLAFKKGKDWKKIIDLLVKNLPVKKVIATKFYGATDTGFFAAIDPEEIAKYVSSIKYKVLSIETYDNSHEAVFNALNSTQPSNHPTTQRILVTGSLYLVGEARTLWKLPEF